MALEAIGVERFGVVFEVTMDARLDNETTVSEAGLEKGQWCSVILKMLIEASN